MTVLLVEDNPADADLIEEALDEADVAVPLGGATYALARVDRLASAEERLARGGVGIVLLDLSLPDSAGLATFVRLATYAPEMPIVVLSGLDDEDMAMRAVREGAQDYLVKGQVDGPALLRAMRYAIERKRSEGERAQLRHEQAEAEAALRARDELLAGISHDLKNPLASIKGLAQLLIRRAAPGRTLAPDELVDRLGQIERLTTRMTSLLDELLDVARLEAGHPLELTLAPVELVALARQSVSDAQRHTDLHELRVLAAQPEIVGPWDGARLERVFENLLDNAIKYSPEGGRIDVSLATSDHDGRRWAEIRVRDEGIGIPASDMAGLFRRFFRAGNVSGQIRGTGLGLAGARQVVEQHGGTIAVESREGGGSTFTVRLPL